MRSSKKILLLESIIICWTVQLWCRFTAESTAVIESHMLTTINLSVLHQTVNCGTGISWSCHCAAHTLPGRRPAAHSMLNLVPIQCNACNAMPLRAYFLTQLTQATQRTKFKDESGVYSIRCVLCVRCVACVAFDGNYALERILLFVSAAKLKFAEFRRCWLEFPQCVTNLTNRQFSNRGQSFLAYCNVAYTCIIIV